MVKFGKYLDSHQIPEWSSQYVRYKRLKKVLKQCKAQKEAQLAAEARMASTLGATRKTSASASASASARKHSSAAESGDESGDESGGDVETGRGSISAREGGPGPPSQPAAPAAASTQRASLARQTADVEKALSSGAEWIAKSRAEVGERERQTKAQNAAEASGMQARRLSQVHLQPPQGDDVHNPSNVNMAALAVPTKGDGAPAATTTPGAATGETTTPAPGSLQVRITPPAPTSLGDVGRRGSTLPMPTPLVPAGGAGSGAARHSLMEEEEGDSAHEEHDDQKALSDALSEGKRHLTDALLYAEDMHIRKLSSYIPSRVRATFLPAEHDFFQLLEEDVETCNHFFLKQEEFFLDKINVIVEQLDRLIKEEEEDEARARAAKARAMEIEAQQRKQSMIQRALMQVQQRLPIGSTTTTTKQVNGANGEGPAAPTQSTSPPAGASTFSTPPSAGNSLQQPPPASTSPPPAPNSRVPPPPPNPPAVPAPTPAPASTPSSAAVPASASASPSKPPAVPAPTAACAEAAANFLAVNGSLESGARPIPRHDAAANSGAFPPTMSMPSASPAAPSSAAGAATSILPDQPPALSTVPSSDSLLKAAHYPGADLELVHSHSEADIGTDSGDEHDHERDAAQAAAPAAQQLDHFGDDAMHHDADQQHDQQGQQQQHDDDDADHGGHFIYAPSADAGAGAGGSSTAVAPLPLPPVPGAAPSLAQRMHLNLQFRLLTAQKPWKVLEKALTELYRGLQLLRNYKILQFTAFVKILKKYDKLNLHPSTLPPSATPSDSEDEEAPNGKKRDRRRVGGAGGGAGLAPPTIPDDLGFKASALLLPRIQSTHFLASPILKAFIRRVELIYAHTFTKGNHKAALEGLRIVQPPLSQAVIFRLGLLLGVSGVLCAVLIVLASWVTAEVVGSSLGSNVSANLPIWRSLALIILHLWGWGGAVWVFHKYRINHEFIFEINPRTELKFEQVLLLAATLSSIWFIMINLYLLLDLARDSGAGHWAGIQPGYVVLTAFLGMVILALYPGDFLFRPTRWYILRTLGKIVTAPLWAVDFKDFYVADQLTSLVNVLNDICYSICHLGSGAFLDNRMADTQCTDVQNTAVWCLAFLPYWWRFLQCLRKYRDNPPANRRQLVNSGKYAASMFTTLFALLYRNVSPNFLVPWICVATLTTLYTYTWDVVCDWGFVQFEGHGRWPSVLRRKLLLKSSGPYYFALVSNLLLRVSWVFTISPSRFGINLNKDIFNSIVWALEILRRNQWNVYRLENEHLTNCENYRVVNIVPLKMDGAVLLGNTAEQAEKIAAAEEDKFQRGTGGGGGAGEAAVDPDALVVETSRERAARMKEHARKRSREIELQSRIMSTDDLQPSSPTGADESLPLDPSRRRDRDNPTVCSMLTAPDARVLDPDRHDNPDMHEATFRSGSGSRKGSFADAMDTAGAPQPDWTVHLDETAVVGDSLKQKLSPSVSDLAEQHDAALEQAATAAQQQQQWPQPSEVSPDSIVNRPYGGVGVDSTLSPVQPYVNPNVQHALALQEQEQAVIHARRQSLSGASAAGSHQPSRSSFLGHPQHHPVPMMHAASSMQLGGVHGGIMHSRFPSAVSPRHFQATTLAPASAGGLLQRQFSDPMMTDNIARRAATTARKSARRTADQQLYGTGTGVSPSGATPSSVPYLPSTPPAPVPTGSEAAGQDEVRPGMPDRNLTTSVLHRSRKLPRSDDVSTGDDWLMHTGAFGRDAADEAMLPSFTREAVGSQSAVVAQAQRAATIAAGQAGAADGVLSPTGRHAHLRDAEAREEARRNEENAADDLFDRVLARRRAMHQLSAPALAHNAMASIVATTTGADNSGDPARNRSNSLSVSSFPMGYASSGNILQSMPQQTRRVGAIGSARRPSQQLPSSPNLYASSRGGDPSMFQRRATASNLTSRNGSASPLNRPAGPSPQRMQPAPTSPATSASAPVPAVIPAAAASGPASVAAPAPTASGSAAPVHVATADAPPAVPPASAPPASGAVASVVAAGSAPAASPAAAAASPGFAPPATESAPTPPSAL